MPTFAYRAYGDAGPVETGTVEAVDASDAARQLQRARKRAFEIRPVDQGTASFGRKTAGEGGQRLGAKDLAQLFQEVAALQKAGFTAFASLRIVAAASAQQRKTQMQGAADRISAGAAFSEAFGTLPGMPHDVRPMLASGESSGRLVDVLERLAESFAGRAAVQKAILDAIAYPAFLVLAGLTAVLFFALYLIPSIEPLFAHQPDGAPLAVRLFSWLGAILRAAWPAIVLGLAAGLVATLLAARSRRLGPMASRVAARIPILGKLVRMAVLSRYLHTLSMLLGNGVTMSSALRLAEETAVLPAYRRAFADIREGVTRGERLDAMCKKSGLFDIASTTLIQLGEESNSLPTLLGKAAALLDSNRKRRLDGLLAVLSPLLTIAMGILIGGLVLSVMTALLAINDAALQ
jgi:general secretion pathway protein F